MAKKMERSKERTCLSSESSRCTLKGEEGLYIYLTNTTYVKDLAYTSNELKEHLLRNMTALLR